MNIRLLHEDFDIAPLAAQLAAHPEVWNQYRWRTESAKSPHREASDIWVRYNALENFGPHFNDAHDSVWYPVIEKLPAAVNLAHEVMERLDADYLGGILITKIPAGKQVYPHSDQGWHALHYQKIAVQIAGNDKQAFCFEDGRVSAKPGQSYWFNNQATHWVTNRSAEDRMTFICCIRRIH